MKLLWNINEWAPKPFKSEQGKYTKIIDQNGIKFTYVKKEKKTSLTEVFKAIASCIQKGEINEAAIPALKEKCQKIVESRIGTQDSFWRKIYHFFNAKKITAFEKVAQEVAEAISQKEQEPLPQVITDTYGQIKTRRQKANQEIEQNLRAEEQKRLEPIVQEALQVFTEDHKVNWKKNLAGFRDPREETTVSTKDGKSSSKFFKAIEITKEDKTYYLGRKTEGFSWICVVLDKAHDSFIELKEDQIQDILDLFRKGWRAHEADQTPPSWYDQVVQE